METTNDNVLMELIEITRINLNHIEQFKQLSLKELNLKENKESWSILECIAHLNIYGDFYLPELAKGVLIAEPFHSPFKSGLLGGYFVQMIRPKKEMKRMKTMKKFNPVGSKLDASVLEKFKQHQLQLLDLLVKASSLNINKTKTAVSISKIIKMRLGDTFQFVVFHNQRHIIQAKKVQQRFI